MKKLIWLITISLSITLMSFTIINDQTIKGWFLAGSSPNSSEIGLEKNQERNSKVAYLRSTESEINGFGTIMQNFMPDDFLGKKIKLTGYIKSKNIKKWLEWGWKVVGQKKKNWGLAIL